MSPGNSLLNGSLFLKSGQQRLFAPAPPRNPGLYRQKFTLWQGMAGNRAASDLFMGVKPFNKQDSNMAFTLPDLPFAPDAFGDLMSAETFSYHHGKHHKAYVDKTNAAVKDTPLEGKSLLSVIEAAGANGDKGLFNNAAQTWNHSFFWQCLSPDDIAMPENLKAMIERDFGSVNAFHKAFKEEAVGHFASGWAWLVLDNDALKITSLHDADTPVAHGLKPLLTIDVWEHAYYLDYQNARPDYVQAVLDRAINWNFVAQNLDGDGASRADQPG